MDRAEERILARIGEVEIQAGKVYILRVYHDDDCLRLTHNLSCNCDPEVAKPELVPERPPTGR